MMCEMVQDCPPAHQMLRTAETIQARGLQLAECEGESVGGVEGNPFYGAPGQAGVDRPRPGPGPGSLQLQLLGGLEEGGDGGAADVGLPAQVGGDGGGERHGHWKYLG